MLELPSQAPRRPLTLLTYGLLSLLLLLSLLPKSASRFYAWPWYLAWQCLLLLPPLIFLARLLFNKKPVPRFGGLIDAGILFGLFSFTLSCFLSPRGELGFGLLSQTVAYVSLSYLLLSTFHDRQTAGTIPGKESPLIIGALCSGTFVIVGLSAWLLELIPLLSNAGFSAPLPRNEHPFGHSLYTGGAGVLALGFLAYRAWRTKGLARSIRILATLAALLLVYSTKSRAALAAVVAGAACLLPAWWLLKKTKSRTILLSLSMALGAALCAFLLDPRLSVLVKTGHWGASAQASNLQRQAMTQAGLEMGLEKPWLGQGPGTVPLNYPKYAAGEPGAAPTALELHSTPVQIWAELGFAGLLTGLLLSAGILIKLIRLLASEEAKKEPAPVLLLLYCFTGYTVMSLTDFQLDIPLITTQLICLLAALTLFTPEGDAVSPKLPVLTTRPGLGAATVIAMVLAISVHTQIREVQARNAFSLAAEARETGDYATFISATKRAVELDPKNSYYLNQLANMLSEPNEEMRAVRPELLITLLQRSLLIDPDQEFARFNLGWLLLTRDPVNAEKHLRRAIELTPEKSQIYLGLGLALLNQGRRQDACKAIALEFLNNPSASTLPLWESPLMEQIRHEAIKEVRVLSMRFLGREDTREDLASRLRYDRALERWWDGEMQHYEILSATGNPAQVDLIERLKKAESPDKTAVASSVLETEQSASLQVLKQLARSGTIPPNSPFEKNIAQLAAQYPGSLRALLRAPVDTNPELQVLFKNLRKSGNLLMRNQDGWPLSDFAVIPERKILKTCFPQLFSPIGGIPTRFLLDQIQRIPNGNHSLSQ